MNGLPRHSVLLPLIITSWQNRRKLPRVCEDCRIVSVGYAHRWDDEELSNWTQKLRGNKLSVLPRRSTFFSGPESRRSPSAGVGIKRSNKSGPVVERRTPCDVDVDIRTRGRNQKHLGTRIATSSRGKLRTRPMSRGVAGRKRLSCRSRWLRCDEREMIEKTGENGVGNTVIGPRVTPAPFVFP